MGTMEICQISQIFPDLMKTFRVLEQLKQLKGQRSEFERSIFATVTATALYCFSNMIISVFVAAYSPDVSYHHDVMKISWHRCVTLCFIVPIYLLKIFSSLPFLLTLLLRGENHPERGWYEWICHIKEHLKLIKKKHNDALTFDTCEQIHFRLCSCLTTRVQCFPPFFLLMVLIGNVMKTLSLRWHFDRVCDSSCPLSGQCMRVVLNAAQHIWLRCVCGTLSYWPIIIKQQHDSDDRNFQPSV